MRNLNLSYAVQVAVSLISYLMEHCAIYFKILFTDEIYNLSKQRPPKRVILECRIWIKMDNAKIRKSSFT